VQYITSGVFILIADRTSWAVKEETNRAGDKRMDCGKRGNWYLRSSTCIHCESCSHTFAKFPLSILLRFCLPRASISLSPASARMSLKVQWKAYFMHASICAQLREILIAVACAFLSWFVIRFLDESQQCFRNRYLPVAFTLAQLRPDLFRGYCENWAYLYRAYIVNVCRICTVDG